MRFVSFWTRSISASCARLMTAGLSVSTSLPCCIAAIEMLARSAGIAEPAMTSMLESSRIASIDGAGRDIRVGLGELGDKLWLARVVGDEFGPSVQEHPDVVVDVVVVETDDREPDPLSRHDAPSPVPLSASGMIARAYHVWQDERQNCQSF